MKLLPVILMLLLTLNFEIKADTLVNSTGQVFGYYTDNNFVYDTDSKLIGYVTRHGNIRSIRTNRILFCIEGRSVYDYIGFNKRGPKVGIVR